MIFKKSKFETEGNLSGLALPIVIIFFSWGFGTGALWVARPLFTLSFGVSLFFVGLISSLSAGPRMISGPITGYLSDRWGRKPLIMIGAIGHGTVLVLQAFSTNFFQYAVLEVFAGLAIAFWVVSSGVLVADVTNAGNRGRGVALRNTAQRVGLLAGPVVGGIIAGLFDLRWVFIFIALTRLVVLLVTLTMIPETKPIKSEAPVLNEHIAARKGLSSLSMFTNRPFAGLVAATFAFGTVGLGPGVFRTYFPIHAQNAGGLDPTAIGNLVGVAGLITLILTMPIGVLLDRYGRKKLIIAGLLATILATFLLGTVAGLVTAFFAVTAFAVAEGTNSNTILTYAMDLAPVDHRGAFIGAYHFMLSFGQVIGPLSAGLLATYFELQTTFFLICGAIVLCTLIFALMAPETFERQVSRKSN